MRRTSLASVALLAGLAGCGEVVTLADAAPDAVVYDANTTPDVAVAGTVKVTVYDGNTSAPAVNVAVVFLNADGSVVLNTKSSGTGTAMAEMVAGGSVTAVVPDGAGFQILTSLDVAPGDEIVLGQEPRDNANAGNFTVTDIPASNSGYSTTVYGPCNSTNVAAGATSATLTLTNDCKDLTTDLLIVQSSAGTTYSILKPNVMFRGGQSASVAGLQWQYDGPMTASIIGMPIDLTSASLRRRTGVRTGYSNTATFTVGQPTGAVSLSAPQATSALMTLSLAWPEGRLEQTEKIAGQSHTYGVDATTMLPRISAVTGDPATGKISWSQPTPGGGDIVLMGTSYSRAGVNYSWAVFGPPSLDSVTLPTLPADVGGVNPTATDTFSGFEVYRLDLGSVPGYPGVREHPLNHFVSNIFGNIAPNETKVQLSSGGAGFN